MTLEQWAQRWGVPNAALIELLNMPLPRSVAVDKTEAKVQQEIRLDSSRIGAAMWRNNNGAAKTDDGRQIRFGLGNDSKRINNEFKSSDLIGPTPVQIVQGHVGQTLGIFTAIECKRGDWSWSGTPREQAQWKFLQLVKHKGGFAGFAKSLEDYWRCLNLIA